MPPLEPAAPREGSIVALVDSAGRLLLQQRDDDGPPAGYGRWALPGGGREGAESPHQTALREFEEETGVRLHQLHFFATVTRDDLPGIRADRLHLFFSADNVTPASISVHEGLDFRFWSPPEIAGLLMNPSARALVDRFLASDEYRETVARASAFSAGVNIIEMDRWGRVLLQMRAPGLHSGHLPGGWSLPEGPVFPGEPPDAAAFRRFEEETGHLLETLHLFRVYHRGPGLPSALFHEQHVYYVDAGIDEDLMPPDEIPSFRYFSPAEIPPLDIPSHASTILADFFASTAYRRLFH